MQARFPAWEEAEPQASKDTLSPLSRRAIAVAPANRGGVGIARMLVEKLAPCLARSQRAWEKRFERHHRAKVFFGAADQTHWGIRRQGMKIDARLLFPQNDEAELGRSSRVCPVTTWR